MSASRDNPSTLTAREVVGGLVRLHGLKRGLSYAAAALCVSESWARKIHYGEAEAISQQVAERAAAARAVVLRQRLAAARREIAEIEEIIRGDNLEDAHERGLSPVGGRF